MSNTTITERKVINVKKILTIVLLIGAGIFSAYCSTYDNVAKWGLYYVVLMGIGLVAMIYSTYKDVIPAIQEYSSKLPKNLIDTAKMIERSFKKELVLLAAFLIISIIIYANITSIIETYSLNLNYGANALFYTMICFSAYTLKDMMGACKTLREAGIID